ncbi:unnamed protein product [Closterium sp. Yama58-4]|nr:unnamed protein product [Closterium sp. Yama58-4]
MAMIWCSTWQTHVAAPNRTEMKVHQCFGIDTPHSISEGYFPHLRMAAEVAVWMGLAGVLAGLVAWRVQKGFDDNRKAELDTWCAGRARSLQQQFMQTADHVKFMSAADHVRYLRCIALRLRRVASASLHRVASLRLHYIASRRLGFIALRLVASASLHRVPSLRRHCIASRRFGFIALCRVASAHCIASRLFGSYYRVARVRCVVSDGGSFSRAAIGSSLGFLVPSAVTPARSAFSSFHRLLLALPWKARQADLLLVILVCRG